MMSRCNSRLSFDAPLPPSAHWIRALALIAVLVWTIAANGTEAWAQVPEALEIDGGGTVERVVDGDSLVLDDGTRVRLVGLQAPKLPLGRPDFEAWPLAVEARAHLADLVDGRDVLLAFGGERQDRHGRTLAHVIRASDSLWIQGAMLDAGMARVYSFPDNRAAVDRLLERESLARDARRGIWALETYRVRSPYAAASLPDTFQIVEGDVYEVRSVRDRVFINFDPNWHRVLSATISPQSLPLFEDADFDLQSLASARVRIRGWVYEHNGPSIELSHPEQIEVLSGGDIRP